HPDRVSRRFELGFPGRGGGRAVCRLDRQRDVGLVAVSRQPKWSCRGEANRRGDQPRRHPTISHNQDTAGPMTRTVRDAAILLNVLAAKDPLDQATQSQQRPADYTADLALDAMKGARIGVPSDPTDPLNDFYYGKLSAQSAKVMADAIKV